MDECGSGHTSAGRRSLFESIRTSGLASDFSDHRFLCVQWLFLAVLAVLVVLGGILSAKEFVKVAVLVGAVLWAFAGGNAQRNLAIAYLVAITFPFVFFTTNITAGQLVEVGTSDLFVVLLFLPWVIGLLMMAKVERKDLAVIVPLALLSIGALVSIPFSFEPRLGLMLLALMVEGGVAYLFVLLAIRSRRDYDLLMIAFLGVAAYLSLYGVMQFMTGSPELFVGETTSRYAFGDIWSGRVRATLSGPNSLSGLLVLTIPLIVARVIRSRTLARFLYLGVLGVTAAALALTFSRNGYLAFIVSIGVMCVLFVRKYRNLKLVFAVGTLGLLLMGVGALKFQPAVLLRLLSIRFYMYDPASILRLMFWKGMLRSFLSHPFTGIGLGNFTHQPFSYGFIASHNVFLNTMGETGIFGIAGLLSLIVVFLGRLGTVYRRATDIYQISESVGLLGSWTALIMHGIFDTVWSAGSHTREIKYIWIFLAMSLVFCGISKLGKSEEPRPAKKHA